MNPDTVSEPIQKKPRRKKVSINDAVSEAVGGVEKLALLKSEMISLAAEFHEKVVAVGSKYGICLEEVVTFQVVTK